MVHAIALSILGGFGTYLVTKIASGGKAYGTGAPIPVVVPTPRPPMPELALPPVAAPAPAPKAVAAPKPAPVEVKPPPPPPPPPPDTSPTLPTPPTPPPVALVVPKAAPAAPAPALAAPAVAAPKPAPVEVTPPPPPPTPPPDTSPTLPTPPTPAPASTERQWGAVVDVPVGDKYADAATRTAVPANPAGVQPPAGFDGLRASSLAPALATHIAQKKYDFDRARLVAFQTAAGVEPDGVYGNDSWGALSYFTSDAPPALYKPGTPTPYPWGKFVSAPPASPAPAALAKSSPASELAPPAAAPPPVDTVQVGPVPPMGFDPPRARSLAKGIAANIDTKGSAYDRGRLKVFQAAAGLESDGLYGGSSRRALIFYGVPRPPSALFKPAATPPVYPWEAQANAWGAAS